MTHVKLVFMHTHCQLVSHSLVYVAPPRSKDVAKYGNVDVAGYMKLFAQSRSNAERAFTVGAWPEGDILFSDSKGASVISERKWPNKH